MKMSASELKLMRFIPKSHTQICYTMNIILHLRSEHYCWVCFVVFRRILRGLNTSNAIEVVFHVIIPKPYWEWDASSKLFLHFGSYSLGNWGENVGEFEQRYASINAVRMLTSFVILSTETLTMEHVKWFVGSRLTLCSYVNAYPTSMWCIPQRHETAIGMSTYECAVITLRNQ